MASNTKKNRLNLSPSGKTKVVRVEISHLNGRLFDHTLPVADIIEIWKKALKLGHIPMPRQANFRGPNNTFRINYGLQEPNYLSDLINNPDITYEKKISSGIDTYTSRVLDIETIEEAKLGEVVTVIVKRTNAELSEEQIANWLMRFGKIVLQPRYFNLDPTLVICSWLAFTNYCTHYTAVVLKCSATSCLPVGNKARHTLYWEPVGIFLVPSVSEPIGNSETLVTPLVSKCVTGLIKISFLVFTDLKRTSKPTLKLTSATLTSNSPITSQKLFPLMAFALESITMATRLSATNAMVLDTENSSANPTLSPGHVMSRNFRTQVSSQQICSATGWMPRRSTKEIHLKSTSKPMKRDEKSKAKINPGSLQSRESETILNKPPKSSTVTKPTMTRMKRENHLKKIDSSKGNHREQQGARTDSSANQRQMKTTWMNNCSLWWNCGGGLKYKIEYIKYTIMTLKPTVLFISEAEIYSNDDLGVISVENYDLLISNTINFGKARTAAYVRSDCNYKRLKRAEMDGSEVISLSIDGAILVGVYRPFKPTVAESNVDNFDRLLNSLRKLESDGEEVYIGGDFNVDWNHETTFNNLALEMNLQQLVHVNTRLRLVNTVNGYRLEESCLDHLYTTDLDVNYKLLKAQPSDHHMLQIILKSKEKDRGVKQKMLIRDWKSYSKAELLSNVKVIKENFMDWIKHGPHSLLDRIVIILLTIYDELVPLRVAKIKADETLNSKIEAIRKRRDRFLKKYKKTGDEEHAIKARTFSKTLKKVIRKESKRTLKVKSTSGNPKCFWNTVSRLQGKFRKKIPGLIIDEVFTNDPNIMTEAFADGFLTKLSDLSMNQPPISYIQESYDRMEDFSMTELENVITKIKSKKASGLDAVPTCIMKDAFDELKEFYLEIFNDILKSGLPDTWRTAIVTPLHKKGASDIVGNFGAIKIRRITIRRIHDLSKIRLTENSFR